MSKKKKMSPKTRNVILAIIGIAVVMTYPVLIVVVLLGAILYFAYRRYKKNQTPSITQTTTPPAPPRKVENHRVAGVTHRIDDIISLATENSDYDLSKRELIEEGLIDERIYQYEFYPSKTELIPEPDNPHDPKAIKVVVDDVHVGYIKAGSCSHIHNLIREDRIDKIECEIGGGKYKYLASDIDEDGNDIYEMEKDESPYFVHISIYEKITPSETT